MTPPAQERARNWAEQIAGGLSNVLDDRWRSVLRDDIAAALLAHGLAERRAGFLAGAKAEVNAMVDAVRLCATVQDVVDAIRKRELCSLPLPGDDRE